MEYLPIWSIRYARTYLRYKLIHLWYSIGVCSKVTLPTEYTTQGGSFFPPTVQY